MADKDTKNKELSRRNFLKVASGTAAGAVLAGAVVKLVNSEESAAVPSEGYLVYDSKKCCGCTSCMMACSMVHEGNQNLSLSRIQISQNTYGRFPYDLEINVCRQCVDPACVRACPTGACYVDTDNGNVRVIDESKCEAGCQLCIQACPYIPHRTIWNPETNKTTKCDLCINTPYWNEKGGPGGKLACVEICPMRALKMVNTVPTQQDTDGYDINLRNEHWAWMGLPTD